MGHPGSQKAHHKVSSLAGPCGECVSGCQGVGGQQEVALQAARHCCFCACALFRALHWPLASPPFNKATPKLGPSLEPLPVSTSGLPLGSTATGPFSFTPGPSPQGTPVTCSGHR
jgi:hypothetical protein